LTGFYNFIAGPGSHVECGISSWTLWQDAACTIPWTDTAKAQLINDPATGEYRIQLYSSTPFAQQTLYIRRETKGNKVAIQGINFETCGSESILSMDPTFLSVSLDYLVGSQSGTDPNLQIYQSSTFRPKFRSNSRLCPIVNMRLVRVDYIGNYVSYEG